MVRLAESFEKQFLRYADTGMFKLLMAVDDKESIHDYYNDCLGNLIEYDNKNKTDYLDTLRCYLDNDSSIAEVAKISFVHRNTVNYKIKKIKEIAPKTELIDTIFVVKDKRNTKLRADAEG